MGGHGYSSLLVCLSADILSQLTWMPQRTAFTAWITFTAWIAFTQQVLVLIVPDFDVKASLSNKS